ncbi:MAG: hypothetical protein ABIH82_03645 [Candidatus Woesearchaeota archaeon]
MSSPSENISININPLELISKLNNAELCLDWQKQHPKSYLSHFFAQIDEKGKPITDWDIGYYDDDSKKITVFSVFNNDFIIKPADDVFKKDSDKVEKLDLTNVKLTLKDAQEKCFAELPKYFPKEIVGSGFLILQSWKNTVVWNFTFITKTLKFANLKINATSGEVFEHQIIELVQK